LPPWTPFCSAANMRSFHTEASTHVQSRPRVFAPCVALSGTAGAWLSLCLVVELTPPPSCLPSLGAALLSALLAALAASLIRRLCLLRRSPLPAQVSPLPALHLLVVPSPTTWGCPVIAYHHPSVTSDFRTSPYMSRLVAAPPPNRVRSPTDRQFASGCSPRCFGPTQLPSAAEFVAYSGTDFHRADIAPSQAHSCRHGWPASRVAGMLPETSMLAWIPALHAGMT